MRLFMSTKEGNPNNNNYVLLYRNSVGKFTAELWSYGRMVAEKNITDDTAVELKEGADYSKTTAAYVKHFRYAMEKQ